MGVVGSCFSIPSSVYGVSDAGPVNCGCPGVIAVGVTGYYLLAVANILDAALGIGMPTERPLDRRQRFKVMRVGRRPRGNAEAANRGSHLPRHHRFSTVAARRRRRSIRNEDRRPLAACWDSRLLGIEISSGLSRNTPDACQAFQQTPDNSTPSPIRTKLPATAPAARRLGEAEEPADECSFPKRLSNFAGQALQVPRRLRTRPQLPVQRPSVRRAKRKT